MFGAAKNGHYYVVVITLALCGTGRSDSNRCVTPELKNGACIDLKVCGALRTLLENQRHVESVRVLLQKSLCGFVGTSPQVCCPEDGTADPTTTAEPLLNYNARPMANVTAPRPSAFPSRSSCGTVHVNRDRIVGGVPSVLGAWPWMVAIGYRRTNRNDSPLSWNCGGTLITNRYAITAAHCTTNLPSGLRPVVARVGDLDLNPDKRDGATPLDVPIERVIPHAQYNHGKKLVNDISLLKLKDSVTYTKYVQPICLPSPTELNHINWDRRVLTVAGWGSTHSEKLYEQTLPPNTRLMEVEIPVTSQEKCKEAYASEKSALIGDSVICAGMPQGGEDSCRGDSGGPLMMPKLNQFYLVGIVSYGPKTCGVPGVPGVYTRVSSFVDWIEEQIKQN